MSVQAQHLTLGARGEGIAAGYLIGLGWRIVERNWRCKYGEIDVVGFDADGTLAFVEVKTRSGLGFGDPLEAITYAKLARLRRLAAEWLSAHDVGAVRVRLDAVGVLFVRGEQPRVRLVRGIT